MGILIYCILIFFIYSFLGWLMEVFLSIIQHHRFINRGFLIGPICPIYGVGCLLIIWLLSRYQRDPVVLFLMAVIICSLLEYITSYIMEKIFKNRWWDYSSKKYNINGRICLECAIPFGIGGCFIFYLVNPLLSIAYNHISLLILEIVTIILLVFLTIDLILSFKIIFNLKNISNSIKCDSTEIITKKVREILNNKTFLYRRLILSFPDMQVKNKLSILKEKINNKKKKIHK